jgi:hypothetical protein
VSEARTPEEDTIEPDDGAPDDYHGPDPEEDEQGDASDEDQGT